MFNWLTNIFFSFLTFSPSTLRLCHGQTLKFSKVQTCLSHVQKCLSEKGKRKAQQTSSHLIPPPETLGLHKVSPHGSPTDGSWAELGVRPLLWDALSHEDFPIASH